MVKDAPKKVQEEDQWTHEKIRLALAMRKNTQKEDRWKHEKKILALAMLVCSVFLLRWVGEMLMTPEDIQYLRQTLIPGGLDDEKELSGGLWLIFPIYATPVFLVPYMALELAKRFRREIWIELLHKFDCFLFFPFMPLALVPLLLYDKYEKVKRRREPAVESDKLAFEKKMARIGNVFAGIMTLSFYGRHLEYGISLLLFIAGASLVLLIISWFFPIMDWFVSFKEKNFPDSGKKA